MSIYTDTPYMGQYRYTLRNRFVNSLAEHKIKLDKHPIPLETHEHVVKALAEYVSALIVAVERPVQFPFTTVIQLDRPITVSITQTFLDLEAETDGMPVVFTVTDKDGVLMCAEITSKYPQFELLIHALYLAGMDRNRRTYRSSPGYHPNLTTPHPPQRNEQPHSVYGYSPTHPTGYGHYTAGSNTPGQWPNQHANTGPAERAMPSSAGLGDGDVAPHPFIYVPPRDRAGEPETEMYGPNVEIRRFYDAPVPAMAEATTEDSELDDIIPFSDSNYAVMIIGEFDTGSRLVLVVDTYTVNPHRLLVLLKEEYKVSHPSLTSLMSHALARDETVVREIDPTVVEEAMDLKVLVSTMVNHLPPTTTTTYFLASNPQRLRGNDK